MTKIAGSGSISQRHGSADPDPEQHQNVMDPEHCLLYVCMRVNNNTIKQCFGSAITVPSQNIKPKLYKIPL
jgi:hypothetical protein